MLRQTYLTGATVAVRAVTHGTAFNRDIGGMFFRVSDQDFTLSYYNDG